ncbi:hypothetical protein BDP27DRAFT_1340719 [Rhodocollybia butyracea]|uniref:Uncharacterized protein n=1 Tax=Rhodocollybia butyracea TaxID=206335 RepID=A0A9P5PCV8_9AGAR|nr:hypothetical protein BDP27DRAFT_1340719 [Rhodocollybia butyracea]
MKPWTRSLSSLFRRLDDYQRIRSEDYELSEDLSLPSPSLRRRKPHHHHKRRLSLISLLSFVQHTLTLRRIVFIASTALFFLVVGILSSGIPSTYEDVRVYERSLPQHRIRDAVTEKIGKDGVMERVHRRKYLWFDGALWGHGLNNVLQESFVMAYVAQLSHRAYVFEDHVWSKSPLPYTIYDFALRPSRIPLNAFISGPSAGGPLPGSSNSLTRRSVSLEFFNSVCHPEERKVLNTRDAPIDASLGRGADEIVKWFVDRLIAFNDEPCVVVDSGGRTLFDRELFGTKRILPIFSPLLESPILANFAWSPLVLSAVARNFAILQPADLSDLYPPSRHLDSDSTATSGVLSGLLAVHLRRGDYSRHCRRLVGWDDEYMGVNQFHSLPDRFEADEYLREHRPLTDITSIVSTRNSTIPTSIPHRTAEEHAVLTPYYLEHCLPEIPAIVQRLHEVRLEYEMHSSAPPSEEKYTLKRIYLLSNGWPYWLNSLRSALKADGWEDVHVSMAVDMAIAEKAEVFVGNGFSSLSGNIVTLRLSRGFKPESNRFL